MFVASIRGGDHDAWRLMEYCYEGPAITNKRVHQEDVTVLFKSLITMRSFLIDEMLGESNGRIGPDESKAGFDTNFHTGIWLVDGTRVYLVSHSKYQLTTYSN